MMRDFSRRARRFLALWTLLCAPAACVACALGDEQAPGCISDGECGAGWICREGACFHSATPMSPPEDPADASTDALDAVPESG